MAKRIIYIIISCILLILLMLVSWKIGYQTGVTHTEGSYQYLDVVSEEGDTNDRLSAKLWRELSLNLFLQLEQKQELNEKNNFAKDRTQNLAKKALFLDAYIYYLDPSFYQIDSSRHVTSLLKKLNYLDKNENFDVIPNMNDRLIELQNGDKQLADYPDIFDLPLRDIYIPGVYEKIRDFAKEELNKKSKIDSKGDNS